MGESITCESRITSVVVYARGAVVTRKVELPAGLPSENTTLVLEDITPLAEPGSVRTHVDGERSITGVQAPMHRPAEHKPEPIDETALRHAQRIARRHQMRLERLQNRLNYLNSMSISADLRPGEPEDGAPAGINERLGAAMGTADLVHDLVEKINAEMGELRLTAEKVAQEIKLLVQRTPPKRHGGPKREVRVTLASGSEHLRSLEVSYNVSAARWWPAYSARLSNGGKQAEFGVEALIVQKTLEDWTDVKLSLCTADMVTDLTMPELQSLRLGRRQEPKRTGFREPPEGLDAMFEAHDSAFGWSGAPMPREEDMRVYASAPDEDYDEEVMAEIAESAVFDDAEMDEGAPAPSRRDRSERSRSGAAKSKKAAGPPPVQTQSAPMGAARSMSMPVDGFGGGAPMARPAPAPEPEQPGVGDQWLDYDSLKLAGGSDARRGRLVYEDASAFRDAGNYLTAVEHAQTPRGAADPLYTRGMFDHQFNADGLLEISSHNKPQRVLLMAKAAKSRMAFRCVPLEDERVFREVEIENPLEAPLLPGPVDVFMDGALLITSDIEATDRGGTIRFGLGEEQRVRVARNVRAREESKGVFGGKIAMDHDVSLEAASSLGGDIELVIIDRLPVSDDKDIDVELTKSEPKPDRYDQTDRNAHVRGGLRWVLPVKAGATAKINFSYRIGFDKDFELVGGNRRD